jgi:hypothetical protein
VHVDANEKYFSAARAGKRGVITVPILVERLIVFVYIPHGHRPPPLGENVEPVLG